MVQKAVIVNLCDICQPTEVPAAYVINATINNVEYALDLCSTHWDTHNISAIIIKGRTDGPSPTGDRRKAVKCEYCDGFYSKGSGMALHVKAKHRVVTDRVA